MCSSDLARQGEGGQSLARLMRQIHDGDDMPFVWQIVIFIGGIVPAVLAVTGIIMWWRARGWLALTWARRSPSPRKHGRRASDIRTPCA